jgi:hypothetical protein
LRFTVSLRILKSIGGYGESWRCSCFRGIVVFKLEFYMAGGGWEGWAGGFGYSLISFLSFTVRVEREREGLDISFMEAYSGCGLEEVIEQQDVTLDSCKTSHTKAGAHELEHRDAREFETRPVFSIVPA